MGAAGVHRGVCSVNDEWRFEERDRVEREMERRWRRRGRDSSSGMGLRVCLAEEKRNEEEGEGGLITLNRIWTGSICLSRFSSVLDRFGPVL